MDYVLEWLKGHPDSKLSIRYVENSGYCLMTVCVDCTVGDRCQSLQQSKYVNEEQLRDPELMRTIWDLDMMYDTITGMLP